MKSVGEQLREARLLKHWTPEAAAKVSKIKVSQLIDLENDDYSKFAGPAYARGFVRIYAKALEINDRKLLAQLDGKLDPDDDSAYMPISTLEYVPEQVHMSAPAQTGRMGQKVILVFGALFVILGIGSLILRFYHSGVWSPPKAEPVMESDDLSVKLAKAKEPPAAVAVEPGATPTPKAAPVEPTVVKPATPVAVPAAVAVNNMNGSHQLTLQVNKSSWARIVATQGGKEIKLFEGTLETGKTMSYQGEKFTVKLAAPSGVNVIFDGQDYGPYSDSDTPETFTIPSAGAE
jgi:cytoskeleton protein RodZ